MRERPLTTFEKSSRHWITDLFFMELSENKKNIYIYMRPKLIVYVSLRMKPTKQVRLKRTSQI